jgi:hypothetical protein
MARCRFAIESRKWNGNEECDVAGIEKHYASNKEILNNKRPEICLWSLVYLIKS